MSEDKAVIAPPRADYLLRLALDAIEAGASAPLVMNVAGLKQAIRHHLDSKPATEQAMPVDRQAAFEAWLENYPIQIVEDDYEQCFDAFMAGMQATQPARAPLSPEQIDQAFTEAKSDLCAATSGSTKEEVRALRQAVVRAIERAHGIGEAE